MHLVGRSNRLFREVGEDGVVAVFGLLNKPVSIDSGSIVADLPSDPKHTELVDTVNRFVIELESLVRAPGRPKSK